MYRLLLPGINIKRWILISIAGVVLFALGFSLMPIPQWDLRAVLWRLWTQVSRADMPAPLMPTIGILFILTGLALVAYGTRRLIRAFTHVANPRATGKQLVLDLLEQYHASPKLRVVGIGGGTGLSTLLRGLKAYQVDLTAVVTVSDDGGSSGRLRTVLDMPPPGDIRNCLVALADAEPLMERLFQHRFLVDDSDLHGHTVGNLVLAGLCELTGDFEQAIAEASRVLAVRGRVLPSADRALVLKAAMADGQIIEGETAIVAERGAIASISIDPPDVTPLPAVLAALQQADVIIVGPGSVYSSLVPNLIIPGMAEAIAASSAIKFFVCNVMTQPGESDDFSASRHLEVVRNHLPGGENPFHYTVVNLQRPSADVMAIYAEKSQQFVEPDLDALRALRTTPVTGNLLADTTLARHDPDRLAECILTQVARDIGWPGVLQRWG